MKVSLYEAHRIVSRLSKEIDESYDQTTELNVFADVDYDAWLATTQSFTASRISTLHRMVDARFFIRRLVQEMNEASGVNEAIADEKRYQNQLYISQHVVTGSKQNHLIDAATLAKQSAALASRTTDSYGSRNYMSVYSVPPEVIEGERENVKGFTRLLDETRTKITTLNHQTYIQLESELVAFLEEVGVI